MVAPKAGPPPLITKVIPPEQFYGPTQPQRPVQAAARPQQPVPPPAQSRTAPKPVVTAEEKMQWESQRVALSRAVARKMRISTMSMSSGDYFNTVNVDNITEPSARCVVLE